MNSSSKEQRVSLGSNGSDRLSELPDHILVHILSFLPTVEAVRTVLIRRFGELWSFLPSLIFHEQIFWEAEIRQRGEVVREEEVVIEENCCRHFANFVRNALLLHKKTPINMFEIKLHNAAVYMFEDACKPYAHEFTTWIGFAVDREVRELIVELDIYMNHDNFILPSPLFTSRFLVTLKLVACRINELSQVHMRSLRKLSLSHVVVSNETFKKIILGSPSLQELDLDAVDELNEVHFVNPSIEKLRLGSYDGLLDCPNLKFLEFHSFSERPMQVVNVSSIREVIIWCCLNLNVFYECRKQFCNVEFFEFSDAICQSLKFTEPDLPQTRWKCLHIGSLLLGDEFSGICRILRSSPNLEELVVFKHSFHSDIHFGTQTTNMLSRDLPSCLMHQLKTVTMRGFKLPCHSLLQLTEYLLKNCVVLEKMVIFADKNTSVSDEQNFVEEVSGFPKASTDATLIFVSKYGSGCL